MKIECILEKLNTPLQTAVRSTSKSGTLPSLQGIYLEAKQNKLIITATNLDIGVRFTIPVKVEKEGDVLVNGDVLAKVVGSIQNNEKNITLELVGDMLHIKTEKSSVIINTLQKDEFPPLPKIEGNTIDIQKSVLVEGLRTVSFAAATTDIKPEIASVYIYNEPGVLVFVATDSFRLAEKKIKVKHTSDFKILIPNKNVQEIIRLCEHLEDNIRLTYSDTMLTIEDTHIYITARVVDGQFPDYRRIIPTETVIEVKMLKSDLQNSLKLSTLFSDMFNQLTVSVQSDTQTVELTTKNQSIGSVEQKIAASISGESIQMNFNYKYIQEVLGVIVKESIQCSFTTNNKAVVLRQHGDDSFLYLIMPLNR
jgi:DNA polymerase III subunit beta